MPTRAAKGPAPSSDRITAWQAVIVAAITGIVSITTTLIATGRFSRPDPIPTQVSSGQTQDSSSRSTEIPAVLGAPELSWGYLTTPESPEECSTRARNAFVRLGYTGINRSEQWNWARHQGNTVVILCVPGQTWGLAITAGMLSSDTERDNTAILRSF
jgi:hypothetical protein